MNIFNLLTESTPQEWEHGWKTSLVVGTRYSNSHIGYNIGFRFPKHPYDCDRTELIDFMKNNGCSVYRCGGYPGAEVFGTFESVKDKETANLKLMEFIPKLHRFMRRF